MNNFIGNNINAIRVEYELNQEAMAEKTGLSQTAISAWECGESTPRKANVLKIIKAFPEITFDDVMSESNGFAAKVLRRASAASSGWVEVPYYGSIAAGEPIEMIDRSETYLVPAQIVEAHPNSGVLQICGNSWNKGGIYDGFFVFVDFDIREPANEHEPFAVRINGDHATVKSIQKLENGLRLLPNSYDETIKPITFDYSKDGDMSVDTLGKVVWTFAPFDYGF